MMIIKLNWFWTRFHFNWLSVCSLNCIICMWSLRDHIFEYKICSTKIVRIKAKKAWMSHQTNCSKREPFWKIVNGFCIHSYAHLMHKWIWKSNKGCEYSVKKMKNCSMLQRNVLFSEWLSQYIRLRIEVWENVLFETNTDNWTFKGAKEEETTKKKGEKFCDINKFEQWIRLDLVTF